MRVGMIGLDTSHVIEFTRIFRELRDEPELSEIEIVAGFPGGSELAISRDRVDSFTEQLSVTGLEIVGTASELVARVDAVMLTSVDGSVHLRESIPILEAGKPLFIDKPLATSVSDAQQIRRLAESLGVPCFSSSCMRFSTGLRQLIGCESMGDVVGAATWGPCHTADGTPDLFFYGIHGIEALFALMGRGCQAVQHIGSSDVDIIAGHWNEGRMGTYRGIRGGLAEFGATLFGRRQIATIQLGIPYRELCVEIARFFRTGIPPVELAESIEILAFMEAANESKRTGGTRIVMKSP